MELGASPRAGIALIKASRARALIHGRDYVVPEDLFALAEDVILHRMRLNYEALADGKTRRRRAPGDPSRPDAGTGREQAVHHAGTTASQRPQSEYTIWLSFLVARPLGLRGEHHHGRLSRQRRPPRTPGSSSSP